MLEKINVEALNSRHCFGITTLESATYDYFPVWPHFPTPGHDISMLELGSEVTASTTLSLSVFASLNPLTAL